MNRINKKTSKSDSKTNDVGKKQKNNKKENDSIKNENIKEKSNKKNKKKSKRKGLKKFLLFLLLLIIFLIIILIVKIHENGGGVQGFLTTILGQDTETLEDLDTIYVLVMGVSEDLGSKLTDTIILCAYNPKQQTASMLSIPRDTFVGKSKTNAKSSDKINTLYSSSSEKCLKAISNLTGIDVKYYAVVNTSALTQIVDIIGGVDFEVPIDMEYDDPTQDLHINLKAGMQKIDGDKAEQLLRFRHSNPDKNGNMTTYPTEYGSDDYGRMKTQRAFITETVKQTLSFKNITKIKTLIKTVFENVETNLSIDDILHYAPYAVNFDTENIDSQQLPGISDKYNDIWFFIPDTDEVTTLVEEMTNKLEGVDIEVEDENVVSDTSDNTIK